MKKERSDTREEKETSEGKTDMADHSYSKGFTLIELIVFMIVLSILSAVAVQKYADLGSSAVDVSTGNFLNALRSANELVYVKKQMDGDSLA